MLRGDIALILTAAAQPTPQPVGACSSGYRDSGGYCAPMSDRSPVAVPKRGQCPSNWTQSGATALRCGRRCRRKATRVRAAEVL